MKPGPGTGLMDVAEAVRALEEQWAANVEPSVEALWAASGPDAPVFLLAALVKADLQCRFARGQRPEVVHYLDRFPELRDERDRVVSLVYEEYCLREERGEPPDPDRFCQRYEPWRDSLESQLRYHRLLSQVAGSPTPRPRFPAPGEHFASRFRLGPILGKGGDAQVYIAHEEELGDRRVALKIAPDRGSEPSILGQLEHPNIVSVLSVCREEGRGLRGISMPYRPGQPLHEVIRRLDPSVHRPRAARELPSAAALLDLPEPARKDRPGWAGFPWEGSHPEGVAWVILTLARALAHAHEREILHCDVKPANILLTVRDGPQLLDFNLAHDRHAAAQAEAALHGGTLPYMAPEQLRAFLDPLRRGDVGPAADLYALGLVMVELLTGHRPEPPDPALPMARAIADLIDRRARPSVSPRALDRAVPHALDAIAARCLAVDPQGRYAQASDLAEDLQRFLQNRPARHARNPSWRESARVWARRHQLGVAVALALVLVAPKGLQWSRLALLKHRVAAAPQSATAHVELGKALEGSGLLAEAQGQYDLAGRCEAAPGEVGAAEALRRGTRERPRSAALKTSLGMTLIRKQDSQDAWEEAREALRTALRIDPTLPTPHHGLALIADRHDHDLEETCRQMTAALNAARRQSLRESESEVEVEVEGEVEVMELQRHQEVELRRQRALALIKLSAAVGVPARAEALLLDASGELRRVRSVWKHKHIAPHLRFGLEFQTARAERKLGDLASDRRDLVESIAAYEEGLAALGRASAYSTDPLLRQSTAALADVLRERLARNRSRLWQFAIAGVPILGPITPSRPAPPTPCPPSPGR